MALHLRKLVEVLNMKGCDRITTTGEVDYDDDDNASTLKIRNSKVIQGIYPILGRS